jgi:hypothetical protein
MTIGTYTEAIDAESRKLANYMGAGLNPSTEGPAQ